jgi:hypothetical protein
MRPFPPAPSAPEPPLQINGTLTVDRFRAGGILVSPLRNQRFESISLQQRVMCEPDSSRAKKGSKQPSV